MSKFLWAAAAIGVAASVSACAIHPLPEDVTGVSTFKIVQKIRCEAREGLKENLINWLTHIKNDPAANELGVELQNGLPMYLFYSPKVLGKLTVRVRDKIIKFRDASIGYDFTFDMIEMNNLDPTLNLTRTLHNKTFTANPAGMFDRTRQNTREFTVTDTFMKLSEIKDDKCGSIVAEGPNYIYPITGQIGVKEMIRTFVGLTASADLHAEVSQTDAESDLVDQALKGPPTLTDQLQFITLLKVSGTPELMIMPIGTALQISSESIGITFSRMDTHSVIIALALDPTAMTSGTTMTSGTPSKLHSAVAQASPIPNRPTFINYGGGTPSERAAQHAIDLFILRFQLNNPSIAVAVSPS
jgi:hypothetical protein